MSEINDDVIKAADDWLRPNGRVGYPKPDSVEVNRLEVIDHTRAGGGREYVKWNELPFRAEFHHQDSGRTLKIVLLDSHNKEEVT